MKKNILLSIVCISFGGGLMYAQEVTIAPPTDAVSIDFPATIPDPPDPPLPPVPGCIEISNPVVINEKGYEVAMLSIKGREYVWLKKDGKEQKIKLDTWLANKRFYQGKYGSIFLPASPPPPPPPPPPFPTRSSI